MPDSKDQTAVMELFKSVPMFSSLDKKHLKTLAVTAADQSYKPGETLVTEGKGGIGFYLIAEGQVVVERGGKTLATLGPGKFFGEMALLDEQPRTATVKAVTRTRCLVLTPWEFWGSVANDPYVLRALLRETVKRLRSASPGPED